MRINNKGVTLVELIVAVGISSILMTTITGMIVGATRYFEKQTTLVEIQNEAQIITNYLTEAVMEATAMDFTVNDEKTEGTFKLYKEGSKDNQRVIYFYTDGTTPGSVYVANFKDDADPGSYADDAYLLSKEITEFVVELEKGEEVTEAPTTPAGTPDPTAPTVAPTEYVSNPIKVKIDFTIKRSKYSSKFSITADCRNHLDKVTINGTEYETIEKWGY